MSITEQRTAVFQRLRGWQHDTMRAIREVDVEIYRVEFAQRAAERLITPKRHALEASARDFVADIRAHVGALTERRNAMRDELAHVAAQIFELQQHTDSVEPTPAKSPLARYTTEEIDEWLARR